MYTYCYINNTIRIIYQAKYFFDARSTLSCNRLVHGMRITPSTRAMTACTRHALQHWITSS